MSEFQFAMKRKFFPIIYVITIFESVFHTGQCGDDLFWCGNKQEREMKVFNGRNVSVGFKLAELLSENQSIVWSKWTEETNELLDDIDKLSGNQDRYEMLEITEELDLDLFIVFSETSDSGKYVIMIHQNDQPLCTIALFNLTIESTEPVCSTLYDQESQRLQMSCEWMQVKVGDQVQLLSGDQVVYEYGSSQITFNGTLYANNKVSVFLPIENLYEGQVMPTMCRVSTNDSSVNNCLFPMMQAISPGSAFNCCTGKLWYTNGSNLFPFQHTKRLYVVNEGRYSFLCSVQKENETDILLQINHVYYWQNKCEEKNILLTVSGHSDSYLSKNNGNVECENIYFEYKSIEDVIPVEENNTEYTVTIGVVKMENSLDSEGYTTTNRIPNWIWSLLALSITFCLATGFANCYYVVVRTCRFRFQESNRGVLEIDPTAAIRDTDQQSEDIGNSELLTDQRYPDTGNRRDPHPEVPQGNGILQHNRDAKVTNSFRQDAALVHKQGEPRGSCSDHRPTNSAINARNNSGAVGIRESAFSANPGSHARHGFPIFPGTEYCSVDDIKGTTTDDLKEQLLPNAPSFQHATSPSNDHLNAVTFSKSSRLQHSAATAPVKGISEVDANVDALSCLYSKPDMSKKTNRMADLGSEYDDPRPPGLPPCHDPDSTSKEGHFVRRPDVPSNAIHLNHTDFYGNAIANPTDEVANGEELYINY